VEDAVAVFEFEEPYPELVEVDAAVEDDPDKMPIVVMKEAFQAYFIDKPADFNKTLFHFLLKRLGRAGDPMALLHCRDFLERHPEETSYVLQYMSDVEALPDADGMLVEFLQSPQGRTYPHQRLQIMKWRARQDQAPTERFVGAARELAFDAGVSRDLRAVSRQIIGASGNVADLERLETEYERAHDELERAQIILSVTRMERQRRNAFLARAQDDGELPRRAVALVRAQSMCKAADGRSGLDRSIRNGARSARVTACPVLARGEQPPQTSRTSSARAGDPLSSASEGALGVMGVPIWSEAVRSLL
jgi:hypothetical protein